MLEGKAQAKQAEGPDPRLQPQHKGNLLVCDIRLHTGTLNAAVTVVGRRDGLGQYMQSGSAFNLRHV